MLLSKLISCVAKLLMCPEEVFPMAARSATDGGPPCLSLVLHPERATG
jgi:hypothetical protein